MTTTPTILDSVFADKGDNPNDNAGQNPYESCDKHPDQKNCDNIPNEDGEGPGEEDEGSND